MDAKLKGMLQKVVNMSHAERVNWGRSTVDDILAGMRRVGITGDDYANFIMWVIKLFVSADKVCSQEEYDLICDIYDLNMSSQDFFDMTNRGADPTFVRDMINLINSLANLIHGLYIMTAHQVEAETINVVFVNPMLHTFNHEQTHHRLLRGCLVTTTRTVTIDNLS